MLLRRKNKCKAKGNLEYKNKEWINSETVVSEISFFGVPLCVYLHKTDKKHAPCTRCVCTQLHTTTVYKIIPIQGI